MADALLTLFLLSGFLAFTMMAWVFGFKAIDILTELDRAYRVRRALKRSKRGGNDG